MAVKDMLRMHEDDLDVDALTTAIEALLECAAHCNICAEAFLARTSASEVSPTGTSRPVAGPASRKQRPSRTT